MDLIERVTNLGEPHVVVVGDLMLDRYVWGNAERISQEAPVILLRADRREERLGGASSVATMLQALGARVSLAGVVGDDLDGRRIREIVRSLGIDDTAVLADPNRPSTVKERYIGRAQARHPQQMIRVDYEDRSPVSAEVEARLADAIERLLETADLVLISDYDKGVCTPSILARLIGECRDWGLRVIADPIRGSDYRRYAGCSAITPNRLEAGLATKRTLDTQSEIEAAAAELQSKLDLEAAIITLDKDGMYLHHRDGRRKTFPTRQRAVYDITGAGDMVMSMLGMALAAGAEYDEAIRLANVAGGLEVEKIGVATVSREEIIRDLLHEGFTTSTPLESRKVLPLPMLLDELAQRRRLGLKIAFTNGCFDILHAGHVQYLNEARGQADVLVVGLNSDESIRGLKGPTRPVQNLETRKLVLAAMEAVDFVAVFEEPTPIKLIEAIRPDVLVKGNDYRKDEVVGADLVESYGGRVHLAGLREGFSTTNTIKRMLQK
jgi:D-beta-D-heptose 7-phosphate kinase / D-beta-D-heptose 1-phosphate adenosyltransferase